MEDLKMLGFCDRDKKSNVFAIIGIVVTAVCAAAGVAYLVYRFVNKRCFGVEDECYEFDCADCHSGDCSECPVAADFAAEDIVPDDDANADEAEGDDTENDESADEE